MPQRRPLAQGDQMLIADLSRFGFSPRVVYDIGGAVGGWTRQMRQSLPGAEFHIFEPLARHRPDYRAELDALVTSDPRVRLHPIALGEVDDEIEIAMTDDGVGTSVHAVKSVASTPVRVSCRRLDGYANLHHLPRPELVKMDTQASEDAIIRGMGSLVDSVQVFIIESWLRRCYGPKTPLLNELVGSLREQGFTFVRIIDEYYNQWHELLALDAVFVRRSLLEKMQIPEGGLIEQV